MKTIKTYTNDSDYLIKIIEKEKNYCVVIFDSCNIEKSKLLRKFDNLNDAKAFAEYENEQYNFD